MPDPNEPAAQAVTAQPAQTTEAPAAAQAAAATVTPQAGDPANESISLSEAKKLRKEAKALRERLSEAEEARKKLEQAQMTDAEKTAAELKETSAKLEKLQGQHQSDITHYAVALASQKLGVVDPEVVARLIDPAELQYDKEGLPTNVEKLVAELIEEKPYLKATTGTQATPPPTSAGAVTNPATQATGSPNSAAATRPGNFDEYLKNKDLIWRSIQDGSYQG